MKIHIITIGKPKLAYAQAGLEEYVRRLKHFHPLQVTHLSDRHNDVDHILGAVGRSFLVALAIEGKQLSSHQLSAFLEKRLLDGRDICFVIGGPDGLPAEVLETADLRWSFSDLTLPHDLAMVVLAESLYRACAISAGLPYHH
ncbi:MAG: hypothetical protein JWM37_95 [Candidatus Saccharibacteria bacterium]|nr:hypothetical protein [Candidatus Saccharibacteria bacterium]